jgi:hypothetical protein
MNINPKNELEEIMKTKFQKLRVQKKLWKAKNIFLCWVFFNVNDNKEMDM